MIRCSMLEKHIQSQILAYLRLKGVFHWRQNTGAVNIQGKNGNRFVRFGKPGISDIIGIYNGRFLAIEVKTQKGRLSEHQKVFLKDVEDNGGIAIVARSVEDVIKGLG